jgi:hypothetical protein
MVEKVGFEILTDLHIFSTPNYCNVENQSRDFDGFTCSQPPLLRKIDFFNSIYTYVCMERWLDGWVDVSAPP